MSDEHFSLSPSVPPPPTEADYEAIAAAVMETVRGRWFLAEFAKRNRNADTEVILEAIDRLEARLGDRPAMSPAERMRIDLVEMAKAIAQTRSEIAAIRPDGDTKGTLSEATEELGSIVQTTERATSDILAAAEQVQEIAWTLREHGTNGEVCDALDRRATDIYSACSFQDLTGQRTRKVVDVLQFLEERIRAMIEIWGGAVPDSDAPPAAAPPHIGNDRTVPHLDQPGIDRIMPAARPAAAAEVSRNGHDAASHRNRDDNRPATPVEDHGDRAHDAVVAAPNHPGAAAAAEAEMVPEPVRASAAAILGATALALDLVPLEFARHPEPAPEPVLPPEPAPEPDTEPEPPEAISAAESEAAESQSEPRTDPAAVLKRILAIIRAPTEVAAEPEAVEDAPPSVPPHGATPARAVAPQIPAPQIEPARETESAETVAAETAPSAVAPEVAAAAELAFSDVVALETIATDAVPAHDEIAAPHASAVGGAPHAVIEDDVADDILMPLPGPVTVDQAVDEMLMKVPVRIQVARAVAAPAGALATAEPAAEMPAPPHEPEAAASGHAEQPFAMEVLAAAPAAEAAPQPEPVHPEELGAPEPEPSLEPEPEPGAELGLEPAPAPVMAEASSAPASFPPAADDAFALAPRLPDEQAPEAIAAATPFVAADPVPAVAPEPMQPPPPPEVRATPVPAAVPATPPAAAAAVAPDPAPPPPPPVVRPAPPRAAVPAPPAAAAAVAPTLPHHDALAAITALSDDEKIALFS